jgi:hypothetical protein
LIIELIFFDLKYKKSLIIGTIVPPKIKTLCCNNNNLFSKLK